MDSAKAELADKLKTANNVLVTVSRNPSVDQLAACIGLTLLLNKLNKHAAAVFSGQVPSTIEFLKPEETLEKTTDSLRDFIIALDKSKADKLRYKVEDNVVRIFITPYRTSISQEDLDFSQGDFNVDVVVALGVKKQEDLDEAITAHGRILHDAAVATINLSPDGDLGAINWHDEQASSLSELVTELAQTVGEDLIDNQIATALLTGIVAETNRFSNDKTSSQTMSISAKLMSAGANQQLVASKLEGGASGGTDSIVIAEDSKSVDGTLEIKHVDTADESTKPVAEPAFVLPSPEEPKDDDIGAIDLPSESRISEGSKLVTEPPSMGGTLTANFQSDELEPSSDPMTLPDNDSLPMLSHNGPKQDTPPPITDVKQSGSTNEPLTQATASTGMTPAPLGWAPPAPADDPLKLASEKDLPPAPDMSKPVEHDKTLSELEKSVQSPHVAPPAEAQKPLDTAGLDAARDEVTKALGSNPNPAPEPIQALNAQPMGGSLHIPDPPKATPLPDATTAPPLPSDTGLPPGATTEPTPVAGQTVSPNNSALPPQPASSNAPPVPPPIPFQFGNPGGPPKQ